MRLLPGQTDEDYLAQLGREAVRLLETRDFRSLADRFGYALKFAREPAAAIEEQLQACITEFQASPEQPRTVSPSVVVKYFKPNTANLFALVECVFIASQGYPVLAELIVTSKGKDRHITLEQISLAAA